MFMNPRTRMENGEFSHKTTEQSSFTQQLQKINKEGDGETHRLPVQCLVSSEGRQHGILIKTIICRHTTRPRTTTAPSCVMGTRDVDNVDSVDNVDMNAECWLYKGQNTG